MLLFFSEGIMCQACFEQINDLGESGPPARPTSREIHMLGRSSRVRVRSEPNKKIVVTDDDASSKRSSGSAASLRRRLARGLHMISISPPYHRGV